jgi:hypothetical protein
MLVLLVTRLLSASGLFGSASVQFNTHQLREARLLLFLFCR